MITRQEYLMLEPYEADFNRAVNAGYKLPTSAQADRAVEMIFDKYIRTEKINWGCGQCAYKAYRRVGQMYYEYKNRKNNKEEQ